MIFSSNYEKQAVFHKTILVERRMSSKGKMEIRSSLAEVGNRARDGLKISCA